MAASLTTGEPFPELKGELLTGRPISLPAAAKGRVTLVAMGFSIPSRAVVDSWASRFRRDFSVSGATAFEIPMIGPVSRVARWIIDGKMKSATPKDHYAFIVKMYGPLDNWKRFLGYYQKDAAYLVLLDTDGSVRWSHGGAFDETAYQQLSIETQSLLRKHGPVLAPASP